MDKNATLLVMGAAWLNIGELGKAEISQHEQLQIKMNLCFQKSPAICPHLPFALCTRHCYRQSHQMVS